MLDMFSTDQANIMADASRTPLPTLGTTGGEAFSAALVANQSQGRLDSQTANAYDFVQQHLDAYQAKTGEELRNPLAIPLTDPNAYAQVVVSPNMHYAAIAFDTDSVPISIIDLTGGPCCVSIPPQLNLQSYSLAGFNAESDADKIKAVNNKLGRLRAAAPGAEKPASKP